MAPRKILAIKLRALGDTVLMTAPLAELRRAYPEAEIHAAILSPWAPLLQSQPGIDRIWTYDRHQDRASRAKSAARLALKLRKEKFDCVVNFHASPSSAMVSFATGAKLRSIHFHGHKDKNRYSTVIVPGKGILKPIIERDMDAVRALGIHVPAGRNPKIHLQATEKEAGSRHLTDLGLAGPVLAIGLGASRPTKKWSLERFAALAVAWAQEQKSGVLAIAGPEEKEELHQFLLQVDDLLTATVLDTAERATIRTRISTIQSPPLRRLAALLSQVAVYAGNDSGPKHVAIAVDTPTVTVFGPEDPYEWHPYSKDTHPYLYVENLPCRRDADIGMPPWCSLHVCETERHKCMQQIGVDPVLSECKRVAKR